ncbi:MAG: 50S ribosomal protein L5 [Candidatus Gracilibacteria bacterium]|nr:50S ribosomal protein L5 [Candidatus Gracilibacteria bacterium]
MNEFKDLYQKTVIKKLKQELKIKNEHDVPRISKVVVNVGIGKYYNTVSKDFSVTEENLSLITGQKPSVRLSRASVSNFKMRENTPNGLTVTLRGTRMYDFLNKLVNVALPRVRDFRGISPKAFDKDGNYSLGIREHGVFPEAKISDELKPFSLQVTVVIKSKSKEHSFALLKEMGFPFYNK